MTGWPMFRAVVVLVFAIAHSQCASHCGFADLEANAHTIDLRAGEETSFSAAYSAAGVTVGWKNEALDRARASGKSLCSWTIRGIAEPKTDDTRVAIAFSEANFNLPPPNRNNTALQIYDGSDDAAPELEPDEHRNCYSPHKRSGPSGRGFCGATSPKLGHFFVSSGAEVHVALRTTEYWHSALKLRFKAFAFRPIDGITSTALRLLPFDLALPCRPQSPLGSSASLTFETREPTYTKACTSSATTPVAVPGSPGSKTTTSTLAPTRCDSFTIEAYEATASEHPGTTSDKIVWPLQNNKVDPTIPEGLAVAKINGNEQEFGDQRNIVVVHGRIFMNTAWDAAGSERAPRLMLRPMPTSTTTTHPAVQIWPRNGTADPILPPSSKECNNGWSPYWPAGVASAFQSPSAVCFHDISIIVQWCTLFETACTGGERPKLEGQAYFTATPEGSEKWGLRVDPPFNMSAVHQCDTGPSIPCTDVSVGPGQPNGVPVGRHVLGNNTIPVHFQQSQCSCMAERPGRGTERVNSAMGFGTCDLDLSVKLERRALGTSAGGIYEAMEIYDLSTVCNCESRRSEVEQLRTFGIDDKRGHYRVSVVEPPAFSAAGAPVAHAPANFVLTAPEQCGSREFESQCRANEVVPSTNFTADNLELHATQWPCARETLLEPMKRPPVLRLQQRDSVGRCVSSGTCTQVTLTLYKAREEDDEGEECETVFPDAADVASSSEVVDITTHGVTRKNITLFTRNQTISFEHHGLAIGTISGEFGYRLHAQAVINKNCDDASCICNETSFATAPESALVTVGAVVSHCAFAVACSECPDGFRCVGGNQTICAAGHFCERGIQTPCPAGRHQPAQGQTTCIDCSVGKFQINEGEVQCRECDTGKFQNLTRQSTDCNSCQAGKFQSSKGADSCRSCAPGQYQESEEQDKCKECSAGYYCTNPSGSTKPSECPAGQYCPTTSADPIYCEAGRYQKEKRQTQCELCPAGRYQDKQGQLSCDKNCEAGYTCFAGSSQSTGTGSKCPQGNLCAAGSAAPQVCEAGYFCPDGKQQLLCPAGHFCPKGSVNATKCGDASFFCPAGSKERTSVGATNFSVCRDASTGELTLDETICPIDTRDAQAPCTAGHYCSQGNMLQIKAGSSGVCADGFSEIDCAAGLGMIGQQSCDDGEYSPGGGLPCAKCPSSDGVVCKAGEGWRLKKGFWIDHVANSSFLLNERTPVLQCSLDSSCIGWNQSQRASTSDILSAACSPGRTGPMCEVCNRTAQYVRQGAYCVRCRSMSGPERQRVILTILGILLAMAAIGVFVFKRRRRIMKFVHKHLSKGLLKIVFGFYSLIATVTFTVDVPWPVEFETFTANLKVMFFDFVQIAGLLCEVKVDFYTSLYVSTMTIVAVLVLIFMFYRSRIRQEPFKSNATKQERFRSKCVKACFYFLVLLYPIQSLRLVQTFVCETHEYDGELVAFLRADYSERCTGPRWRGAVAYSVLWVCLYTLGLPAGILKLLWGNRVLIEECARFDENASIEGHEPLSNAAKQFRSKAGFLFEDYKAKYWYWEVFELVRKLSLSSAMLLFSSAAGVSQVSTGLLICIVLHLWYTHCDPYVLKTGRIAVHVSYFVITITFFVALLLKAKSVSAGDGALGVILVVANLCIAAVAGGELMFSAATEGEKIQRKHQIKELHKEHMTQRMRESAQNLNQLTTSTEFSETNPLARQNSALIESMRRKDTGGGEQRSHKDQAVRL